MTYAITWDEELTALVEAHRREDTFGGYVWPGSEPEPVRLTSRKKTCTRCGINQYIRVDSHLCRDCDDVLSDQERQVWAA